MKNKIIMGFIFLTTISYSQNNNKYPLLDFTMRTDSLMLSELEVDNVFIEKIDFILFNNDCHWQENNIFSFYQYFGILFSKKDSLNYIKPHLKSL